MSILEDKKLEDLLHVILEIDTLDHAKAFFRDLLTESELKEFSKRWFVVQMLHDKKSYLDIEKETGMSSTTIARISKWLNTGMGGYRRALEKRNKIDKE
jgi:TrpR-related protein YerC/YecD